MNGVLLYHKEKKGILDFLEEQESQKILELGYLTCLKPIYLSSVVLDAWIKWNFYPFSENLKVKVTTRVMT